MLFARLKRILKLYRLRLRGPNAAKDEFHLAATARTCACYPDADMNKALSMFVKAGFSAIRLVHIDHSGVHGVG